MDVNAEIRVFDAAGRMVLHTSGSTFDVGAVPAGVYLVEVVHTDKRLMGKLVVGH